MQTLTATVWAAQTTTKWLGALEAICGDGPRRHRRWCSIRYLWAHLSYPWVYLLSRPTTTLSLYTNCTYAFEDQHVTLEYCLSFLGGYWIHMGVLMGLGSWWDRRRPPSPSNRKQKACDCIFAFGKTSLNRSHIQELKNAHQFSRWFLVLNLALW